MTTTPLQHAFAQWRAGAHIDLVASTFRQANQFVVGKKTPIDREAVFYLTRSTNPERVCVTVSEDAGEVGQLPAVSLLQMTGVTLLNRLGPLQEVVVIYGVGGDYLTAEQLAWIRQES